MRYKIKIEGMGCDNCIRAVRSNLEDIGAKVADVQIGSAEADYAGDAEAIKEAVEDAGFDVISIVTE